MSLVRLRHCFPFWSVTLLVLLGSSCGHKPAPSAPAEEHTTLSLGDRYDLARDEEQGGHTLSRHVGKSDPELRARLEEESISTDSTYTDRATAEKVVAAAIRSGEPRIERWLQRPGGHSNLVLDYDSSSPIGRSMRQDIPQSFACSHAVVVLKYLNPQHFYVLTSYPDCRHPQ